MTDEQKAEYREKKSEIEKAERRIFPAAKDWDKLEGMDQAPAKAKRLRGAEPPQLAASVDVALLNYFT